MTGRLPFTLIPLDGEPFDLWLHAYAARLALSPGHLAEALGMHGRQDHEAAPATPSAAQLDAICAASGLAPPAVTAMLAAGPSPPRPLILAWAPQPATRFCPACLAEDPGRMPAAWSLPVTFFCLHHGRLLASRCSHCDRPPASRPLPSQAGQCGGPGAADGSPRRRPGQAFAPGMLDAGALTAAFTLLTACPGSGQDPLAGLVTATRRTPSPRPSRRHGGRPARRWAAGSPAPATPGCALPTGSGTRPRCPPPARRPRARPAPLTWPPPARPGCPTSSGRTGRSASPTTQPPPATTSSCPPR